MKSRVLLVIIAIFFGFTGFGGGYLLGQSPLAPVTVFAANSAVPADAQEAFTPFWEVWNLVHHRYYDQPVDNTMLVEGAIDGMLATLDDPNTRYLSPRDEDMAQENMQGEIQGIGAEVESVDGAVTIVSPIEGSPAAEAGLEPGDIIREADGVTLTGMDLHEAVQHVRGPEGTAVTLTIERDGEPFQVEIVRDRIQIRSVRGEMLEENIAYVRLSRFGESTPLELEAKLTELLSQNPQGLILDLRRNPGGSLDTALNVADQFLSSGTILIERFGDGDENVFEADDGGLATTIPVVVLIDQGSASASEVLAGAIRDNERGILIGQTSFGKGTVQTWQQLSNGGGVRITIARWLTPDEVWVHENGLKPDIEVALPEAEEDFEDTQLQAAIDYLLEREDLIGQYSE